MKLACTRIVTDHVSVLTSFYECITGITAAGCREHYVEIETSAGMLAICSRDSVILFNAGAAEPEANHSLILEFEVTDVDKERTRLAGVVNGFVMEPTNQPWGNRSMLFRDPDGNLINVYAQIDSQGLTRCGIGASE
jgi:predicted enzyme related to lactoylglutathione lyase